MIDRVLTVELDLRMNYVIPPATLEEARERTLLQDKLDAAAGRFRMNQAFVYSLINQILDKSGIDIKLEEVDGK